METIPKEHWLFQFNYENCSQRDKMVVKEPDVLFKILIDDFKNWRNHGDDIFILGDSFDTGIHMIHMNSGLRDPDGAVFVRLASIPGNGLLYSLVSNWINGWKK